MPASDTDRPLRIALVAGETSGDILGADLAKQLKSMFGNDIELIGIAGERMQAEGVKTMADMDTLSIMGLDGLRESLGEILKIRRELIEHFIQYPPDVYIGIDAPDFNLTVEEKLRASGIKTVHYVSPTVWAWRSYRIKKIKRAVDLMLTLFPFEVNYYNKHQVPARFVGHPLAQKIAPQDTDFEFRTQYAAPDQHLVTVMPGSRNSEIKRLAPLFVDTMRDLHSKDSSIRFVMPMVNERLKSKVEDLLQDGDKDFISIILGESHRAMSSSDLVLLASGTAALEAALLARPMIVAYKMGWMTYAFARATTTVKHASMPNHLTDEPLVTEFLQNRATVNNLSAEVLRWLNDPQLCQQTSEKLAEIHPQLAISSSELAVEAIADLINVEAMGRSE